VAHASHSGPPIRCLPAGPHALLIEVASLAEARALHAEIERRRAAGWAPSLTDVVPAARTVLLDGVERPEDTEREIRSWVIPAAPAVTGPLVEIPCRYDGPDLAEVAAVWGVLPAEVAAIHSAIVHEVAFCGFGPGFAYLSGIGEERTVPRRARPRSRVPAGSVALAGCYTGIYPWPSPGGWQLIGRTELAVWDPAAEPPTLLRPGCRVRFVDAGR
jgi:KipI family sensor histidine kinase inhibitor